MIYINGSIIDEKPTGLGVYAKSMIKSLVNLDESIKVFSAVKISEVNTIKINKFVKPSYKKLGGLTRFLWTQFILPFRVNSNSIVYHPFQYLSFFSRSRQVITIHDFIPMEFPDLAKHQYYYYKHIMPHLLKKAYKIVCISENTKADVIKYYHIDESKISVIYNGFDSSFFQSEKSISSTNEFKNKYKIDYKYILMVGVGYEHKNLQRVFYAFKKIQHRDNYKILVAGGISDYALELKKLVKDLDLENKVKFLGYIQDQELPYFYKNAEIFVYPSLYEGFGFPILEAMASETPVLCSNSSSLPEVAGDAAIMFDPRNEDDIYEKISKLMEDAVLRESLTEKGKDNLKRFSWDITAQCVYQILRGKEN